MISFGGGADPICAAEVKPAKPDEFVLSKNINCCDAEHYQTAEDHTVGALSSRFGQGNYKGKQAICNINGGISSRRPIYGQEHVVAERKRREKISQRLIALSAVLPDLKRMDKASVLEEATKYVKHLQERIKKLEMEVAKRTVESVVVVKKTAEDNSSSSDEQTSTFQASDKHLLEIEARVSQKHVLIRVHCERRTGCSAKILDRIGKMNLTVLNNSVLSFGTSLLDITVVAQMEVEFSLTIEELVKNLRRDVLQFM